MNKLYKKYIKWDYVYLDDHPYLSVKAKLWWDNISELEMFHYYNQNGQLKEEVIVNDIIVTNEFGYEIGFVDYREIILVNNMSVIR